MLQPAVIGSSQINPHCKCKASWDALGCHGRVLSQERRKCPRRTDTGGFCRAALQVTTHVWVSKVAPVLEILPANAEDTRDAGLIPGSGRAPGGGHGNPLQYSCLKNPMSRESWRATVHRVAKSRTWLKWLSTQALNCVNILLVGPLLSNQINSTKAKVRKLYTSYPFFTSIILKVDLYQGM